MRINQAVLAGRCLLAAEEEPLLTIAGALGQEKRPGWIAHLHPERLAGPWATRFVGA